MFEGDLNDITIEQAIRVRGQPSWPQIQHESVTGGAVQFHNLCGGIAQHVLVPARDSPVIQCVIFKHHFSMLHTLLAAQSSHNLYFQVYASTTPSTTASNETISRSSLAP